MKATSTSNKQTAPKKAKKEEGRDLFALYAALFVLVVLGIAAFFIYQSRFSGRNAANLTYIELRQTIVNDQGVVARLAVTAQVNTGDEDWLQSNEAILNAYFKKEISTMEVDTLRTKNGIVEAQDELKRRFNFLLKTDKIQAVMVTELLLQDQR